MDITTGISGRPGDRSPDRRRKRPDQAKGTKKAPVSLDKGPSQNQSKNRGLDKSSVDEKLSSSTISSKGASKFSEKKLTPLEKRSKGLVQGHMSNLPRTTSREMKQPKRKGKNSEAQLQLGFRKEIQGEAEESSFGKGSARSAEGFREKKRFLLLAETFQALGDSSRVQIVWLLSQGEHSVGQLAQKLVMSQPAVSHHLRTLRHLHLVKVRKAGRTAFYTLDDHHIEKLLLEGIRHVEELLL